MSKVTPINKKIEEDNNFVIEDLINREQRLIAAVEKNQKGEV